MTLELFQLLEISSFLNIWYWGFLAVAWSRATYWTLGVPFHDARLAVQRNGRYMTEFETLLEVNMSRYIEVFDEFGIPMMALASFGLATLGTLGFVFGMELMQAIFLLLAPLMIASLLSLRFAYRVKRRKITGEALYRAYCAHRRWKQLFGALVLMVIALWAVVRAIVTPTF